MNKGIGSYQSAIVSVCDVIDEPVNLFLRSLRFACERKEKNSFIHLFIFLKSLYRDWMGFFWEEVKDSPG